MDPLKPAAGILVPVFALRREGDLGIGDTKSMFEAIEFCAKYDLGLLQVLPINETGDDNSPYNAISSVALDPVYLTMSPDSVPGLTDETFNEYATPELLAELRAGPVRYRKVKALKFAMLAQAYVDFEANGGELFEEFEQFCQDHAIWLSSYNLFRTLLNHYEGNALWPTWKPEHQSFEAAFEWLEKTESAHDPEGEFFRYQMFTMYCQWVCWRQWQAVRIHADEHQVKLIGDIPFGISRFSADVWADRALFDLEWSGGAPPEPFFPGDKFLRQWGQNWGIPLYDWDAHRSQDFAWWKTRVEAAGSIFHGFRIDHVLGLFRIWSFPWLPQDNSLFVDLTPEAAKKLAGGREPQFIPHPDIPEENGKLNAALGKELLTMLQTAAGSTVIVAEDLGVTPTYVSKTLEDLHIAGFSIPHFKKDLKGIDFIPAKKWNKRTVATWGTHDHATLKAWYDDLTVKWHGPNGHEAWLELQRIMRFLGLNEDAPPREFTPELHETMLRSLLESPAEWVIFTICDVLNLDIRFNSPGTAGDENWSQRLDRPLAEYGNDPVTAKLLDGLKKMVESSGRSINAPFPSPEPEPEEFPDIANMEKVDIAKLESQARALLIQREASEKASRHELPKVERPKDT